MPTPTPAPAPASDRARRERSGWYRHLAAWTITATTLGLIHLPWLIILGIDIDWRFSYTLFPTRSPQDQYPSQ